MEKVTKFPLAAFLVVISSANILHDLSHCSVQIEAFLFVILIQNNDINLAGIFTFQLMFRQYNHETVVAFSVNFRHLLKYFR